MLRFVFHKLINRKWMAICLLIGIVLIVAVAASNPTYSDAMMQRALTKTLSESLVKNNTHPAEITLKTSVVVMQDEYKAKYDELRKAILDMPDSLGIPAQEIVEEHHVTFSKAMLQGDRATGQRTKLRIGSLTDFADNAEIISGAFPSDTVENGVIEAAVSEQLMTQMDVLVGESYEITSWLQEDGKTPYQIKVVGVYRAKPGSDLYWEQNGPTLSNNMVISESLFDELIIADGTYPFGLTSRLTVYLDYTAIKPVHMETATRFFLTLRREHGFTSWITLNENLSTHLDAVRPEATRLKGTLTVLEVPIFVLLAAFIFMVSKQMMEMEENEIAVLKSRGSKKLQILGIYSMQSAILAAAGFLIGYPLSFLICSMLGASNAFLEFVNRAALPIRLTGESLLYGILAAVIAVFVMTMPVYRYTGMTIVQHKVRKHSAGKRAVWKLLILDLIILAVSLYLLNNFRGQTDYLAAQMANGASLDPLLYLSSSLFILGAGLLGIHLIPLLIKLIYNIGQKFWAPPVYTAFLRVLRSTKNQGFIMIFLVLTIALGIFNTATARSINANAEAETVYKNGADVVFQELWESMTVEGLSGPITTYFEPNFEKYNEIEGVASKTKVLRRTDDVSVAALGSLVKVEFMGIKTKEFGLTANFDETLMDTHWYEYLNALARSPENILVSSTVQERIGCKVGDIIPYDVYGVRLRGVVCGVVDYWPGFSSSGVDEDTGKQNAQYLIVGNLDYIQSETGSLPYEVWMKMEDSSQGVYDFAEEQGIHFRIFRDTAADLIDLKNQAVLQGTNGVLTSNFIIVLVLCAVGFLIYWILSIRSRELQFGIFRAMGMSLKEVIFMLVCEQILISGSSILIGVIAGSLATDLFLPLIQLAYSNVHQVLPIRMISYTSDSIRLFVVITLMVAGCMAVLAWLISKIRIAQALKLGED